MPVYVIRIFKSWSARDPERRWSNVYEMQSSATSPGGIDNTVDALVAAEKLIHGTPVQFLSATVSTWAKDSKPYDPTTFYTRELTGTGSVVHSPGLWLDSNVCFLVKLGAGLGRSGRRFYRGLLDEIDVEAAGDGRWTLTAGGPLLQAGVTFAAFRTAMLAFSVDGASADKLVLASGEGTTPTFVRVVQTVTSGGVVINKRNHRYFDRHATGGA